MRDESWGHSQKEAYHTKMDADSYFAILVDLSQLHGPRHPTFFQSPNHLLFSPQCGAPAENAGDANGLMLLPGSPFDWKSGCAYQIPQF